MSRRLFAAFTLPAAALFGCLLTAAPAAAGQGWNLYSWSGGASRNFAPEGYPMANAPYGYPAAGAPVAGYPAAYGPVYAPAPGVAAPAARNTAFYYSPEAANPVADNRVHIRIALPADAVVRFDGEKTNQTGAERHFVSPPLQPGHNYAYDVQAQWKENGHEVTRDRHVTVHAGQVVNLSFTEPEKGKTK